MQASCQPDSIPPTTPITRAQAEIQSPLQEHRHLDSIHSTIRNNTIENHPPARAGREPLPLVAEYQRTESIHPALRSNTPDNTSCLPNNETRLRAAVSPSRLSGTRINTLNKPFRYSRCPQPLPPTIPPHSATMTGREPTSSDQGINHSNHTLNTTSFLPYEIGSWNNVSPSRYHYQLRNVSFIFVLPSRRYC